MRCTFRGLSTICRMLRRGLSEEPGSKGYPRDERQPREALYEGKLDPAGGLGPYGLLPEHEILKGAHHLILAGNTVTPQPQTCHASLEAGFRLLKRLQPKRTWVVHYSGHEDPGGPLSDEQLECWIDRNKGDFDVRLAKHGMTLSFPEAR